MQEDITVLKQINFPTDWYDGKPRPRTSLTGIAVTLRMMMVTHQIQCHLFNLLVMRDIEPWLKKRHQKLGGFVLGADANLILRRTNVDLAFRPFHEKFWKMWNSMSNRILPACRHGQFVSRDLVSKICVVISAMLRTSCRKTGIRLCLREFVFVLAGSCLCDAQRALLGIGLHDSSSSAAAMLHPPPAPTMEKSLS